MITAIGMVLVIVALALIVYGFAIIDLNQKLHHIEMLRDFERRDDIDLKQRLQAIEESDERKWKWIKETRGLK